MRHVARAVTIRRPRSADAAKGYEMFLNKQDNCEKVVLSAQALGTH